MLQVSYIRNNREEVVEKLAIKHFNDIDIIDKILTLDDTRKKTKHSLDQVLESINNLSKTIGNLMKEGKNEEAEKVKQETGVLKGESKTLTEQLGEINGELQDLLISVPNVPHSSVPKGKTSEDNEVIKEEGSQPELSQDAMAHWELAEKYNIIDFELGNKITGSGFPVYKGKGAKFQRSLISFFLDSAIDYGYFEIIPPLMVNEDSGFGTGQLPDKEGQMYELKDDPYFMIPTAEVPVTNIYRDVIIKEEEFPIKMVAYTPCFRREAGSYGKEVRGLNRLHQFDKVEIVQIEHPTKSYDTLDEMVKYVEGLLKKLGLYYRVARLCGGDVSFASALTFDMEVYSGGQEKWLEVSSISNFESFQANRMKLRYKDGEKGTTFAHTLNGSALALPRIVAALLENNQTKDGIIVPEVLRKYTGFELIN